MTSSFQLICERVRAINDGEPLSGGDIEIATSDLSAVIDGTSVAASVLLLGTGGATDGQEIIRAAQSWVRQAALPESTRDHDWSRDGGVLLLARICRLSGIEPLLPDWGGG